jgi:hypothetical protein
MRRSILLAAAATLTLFSHRAGARALPSWPYERLLKEADVVVIAKASSVTDTGETTRDNPWKAEFVGLNTTFEVQATLKGTVENDKLQVLHYRLKPDVLINNGPTLVSFRLRGMTITTKEAKVELGKPSYLLFLKKRKDRRYEPVSGQVDPALSVREMYRPLPAGRRQEKEE